MLRSLMGSLRPGLMLLFGMAGISGAISGLSSFDCIPQSIFSHVFSAWGLSSSEICWMHVLGAGLVGGLIWIATGLINDYYDLEIDRMTNPQRMLVQGIITASQLKLLAGILYGSALIITLAGSHMLIWILVSGLILLGISYSAPPIRLKRICWAGMAAMGSALGFTFLGASLHLSPHLDPGILVVGMGLGYLWFWGSGVKDFKDLEGDRIAGIKTLPLSLGYGSALRLILMGLGSGYGLMLVIFYWLGFSSILIVLVGMLGIWCLTQLRRDLIRADMGSRRRAYFGVAVPSGIMICLMLIAESMLRKLG